MTIYSPVQVAPDETPPPGPARPKPGEPWFRSHLAEVLLLIATAVNVLVAGAAPHFPYSDAPNHLARWVLMDRWWSGHPAPFIDVHLVPTPYVLGDLVGVAFVHLLGPAWGMRAFVTLTLVALPVGMYALLARAAPERRGWALMGCVFGFNAFLVLGNLNFALSVGLTFCWLALWWRCRQRPSWRGRALLVALVIPLYLVHMAGAVAVLGVLGLDVFLGGRGDGAGSGRPQRLVTAAVVAVALALVWLWTELVNGDMADAGGQLGFRTPVGKLLAIGYPFYWTSHAQLLAVALLFGACVLTYAWVNRRDLRLDAFVATGIAFFLFYLAFPTTIPSGGSGLDVRWLPLAFLAPFCMAAPRGRRQGLALLVPFAASLGVAVLAWRTTRTASRDLATYDSVIAALPADSTLLPLVVTRSPRGPIQPYWHYGTMYIVERHGRVPRLFNSTGYRPGDPTEFHLRYFTEHGHLYLPPDAWGTTPVPQPLDWDRIRSDYAYMLTAGEPPAAERYVRAHATEIMRVGDITLFKVPPPPAGIPAAGRGSAAPVR